MAVNLLRAGTIAGVTLAVATVVAQQTSPPPAPVATGLILGRTVDGTTGKALAGAIVSLNVVSGTAAATSAEAPASLSRFPVRVISDSDGRFLFRDLPKGAYSLLATKPGYVAASLGRQTPTDIGSQSLVLGEGERRGDTTMKFWKFATISGRVVDEAGEPVVGVQLQVLRRATVNGRPGFSPMNGATTDDRGIYRAASLSPGEYVVGMVNTQTAVPTAVQEAYAASATASAPPDLHAEITRSGGFSFTYPGSTGQRVGSWVLQTPTSSIRPHAGPPIAGDRVFVYPTVFYPAAPTPSKAMVVALGSGEDRTGVDFQLSPVVTSRVSGTLIGLNGPEPHTVLTLMSVGTETLQRDTDFASASTVSDAAGAFTFLGVTPGAYVIRALKVPARPTSTESSFSTVIQTGSSTIMSGGGGLTPTPIPDDPTTWAALPVTVGETDVNGLTVLLRTGARITGRLEFAGSAKPPAPLSAVILQVDPADGRSTSANQFTLTRGVVDATGEFKTYQLPPGRYLVRASGPTPGWSFKGAFLNGRDVSDMPLELGSDDVNQVIVTFTDRPTTLSGTARDSKGLDATATVLVFPALAASWTDQGIGPRRFRAIRAGTDGSYRTPNLPAGDYFVVAVRSGVSSDWQDTRFLQKLSAVATRVTIADGEQKSLDVETKEVR